MTANTRTSQLGGDRQSEFHGERQTSVAVVGAGPTGVMLAIELARRGVDVQVFERLSDPPTESRATGIHARTLEIFRQLGLVEEFLAAGRRLDGFALHTQRGREVRIRFDGLDTPYPFMLNLRQDVTQGILDRHLERLGVTVRRGVAVTDLRQDARQVELTVAREGDPEVTETVLADWVVGCDGAHSVVRRRLGVSFDGDDYGQDWLMADVELDPAPPRDRVHIYIHTPVAFVALPLPSGHFRVFLPQVPNRGVGERTAPTLEEIQRLAAERGPAGLRLSNPDLLTAFRCYRRSTPTMRHGRVLIAGDAAHIHSPAGGQGLNTGLQDAHNLGWKLALVAQQQASPALLDSYQSERHPIAAGVLELSHAMISTFNVPSARRRRLRDRVLPAAVGIPAMRHGFTRRVAELSVNYRGGPLAERPARERLGGLVPGDRVPDAPCLSADGRPVSTLDLLSARHTLLILSGEKPDPDRMQALARRFDRFGELVDVVLVTPRGVGLGTEPNHVTDPNLRAHDRYGARAGRLMLVRPDGYLAAYARLDHPERLERYLLKLTGPVAPAPGPGRAARASAAGRTRG